MIFFSQRIPKNASQLDETTRLAHFPNSPKTSIISILQKQFKKVEGFQPLLLITFIEKSCCIFIIFIFLQNETHTENVRNYIILNTIVIYQNDEKK